MTGGSLCRYAAADTIDCVRIKARKGMRVFTALPMTDWRQAGPAARAAEDIGFDALRISELGHEVFIPLAVAALATDESS
jgi:hypothetical protein